MFFRRNKTAFWLWLLLAALAVNEGAALAATPACVSYSHPAAHGCSSQGR